MSWVGIFALLGCCLIWTLPESPRWLVQNQQQNEAACSLRILRQSNMIDAELDEIVRQEATLGAHDKSIYSLFITPRFRWPLFTSIALNAVQQFSGINTVSIIRKLLIITIFIPFRYSSIQVQHSQQSVGMKKKLSGVAYQLVLSI
jgi:hypothetical protein